MDKNLETMVMNKMNKENKNNKNKLKDLNQMRLCQILIVICLQKRIEKYNDLFKLIMIRY